MNEKEKGAFRLVYEFYAKWRDTVIETDAQWEEFAKDVGHLNTDLDTDHNVLGANLMLAAVDTINALYQGGAKPLPAGYFGRDDL